MTSKQLIVKTTKSAKRTWSWYYMKDALKELQKDQMNDELEYTEALLGFNRERKGIFKDPAQDKGWGRRVKDLSYGYWNEEDLRLKLAHILSDLEYCKVHGQIHLRGKTIKKERGKRTKGYNMYPDLYVVAFKGKTGSWETKEERIESNAIELKYFHQTIKKDLLKGLIEDDIEKLYCYQNKNVSPKADTGFFVCVDESNQATPIIESLLRLKRYKYSKIGYGIIIPKYSINRMPFPRYLEDVEQYNRVIQYLITYIMAQLVGKCVGHHAKARLDDDYHYFNLSGSRNSLYGSVHVCPPKYVNGFSGKYIPVIIRLDKNQRYLLSRFKQLNWNDSMQRFVFNEEDNESCYVLFDKINKSHLVKIAWVESWGDYLANKILKLHNRWLRT